MKVVIIGSGNVATHLSNALFNINCNILQIYSRNINSAKLLAKNINSEYTNDIKLLNKNADIYIVSVTDNAIKNIIEQTDYKFNRIVHTAGSVDKDIFKNNSINYGVFYPFQTFSKDKKVNFSEIPICIEANNNSFEKELINLAKKISKNVYKMNSEQRKYLHIAGVFANNFVNHLYYIAGEVLKQKNIDAEIINPLIKETANKLEKLTAFNAQTGPALRKDIVIIKKHLDLLSSKPEFMEIYKIISENIYNKHTINGQF